MGNRQQVSPRRRGTAIVETDKGIIVAAGSRKVFLLPGGKADHHESRTQAAMRELTEETGMRSLHARVIFRHLGEVEKSYGHGYFQDHHTVCLVEAVGTPRPRHEIKYIDFYKPGCSVPISGTTKEIIDKYYNWKMANTGESNW